MLFEECHENLLTFLRSEIVDPLDRGKGWIYPDYPREDATFPRLSLTHLSTSREEIGMGDAGSRFTTSFEIGVWTNSKGYAEIGEDIKKGSELREYLADQVTEAFVNKRGALKTSYAFLDARIVGTRNYPYDEDTDLYRKDLFLEVAWDKVKA